MPGSRQAGRHGPQLPYELIAGVEPCPGGWLMVAAKLQGITMAPQPPEVLKTFRDLLDYRPAISIVAIHLPLGLKSQPTKGGRKADIAARQLLRWPRAAAVASPPTYADLEAWESPRRVVKHLSAVTRSLLPRISEVYEDIGSYHQRSVFEVHPELGFYHLNGEHPLRYGKHTEAGREERLSLLKARIPGVDRALGHRVHRASLNHIIDATADLWTARRIAARAVRRLPEIPEWDDQGLRMELVY